MLLRYFADDTVFDIEVPDGSRIDFHSHVRVGDDAYLDDLLLLPWDDRIAPIPGEILPVLARYEKYGLSLVDVRRPAPEPRRAQAG